MAHILGPLVQFFFFWGPVLLFGCAICAAAFWGARRLLQAKSRMLRALPFPLLSFCLLYGVLRGSGRLVYPSDGWDPSGIWNQTHQNEGTLILFLCGCLLIGAVLAVCKKRSA